MKLFIIFALMLSSILFGDEVQRVDDMISDINKLRTSYEQCREKLSLVKNSEVESGCKKEKGKLKEYKFLIKQERAKVSGLIKKVTSHKNLNTKVEELEKKLKIEQKVLKAKDKRIITLKNSCKDKKVKKAKTKEKTRLTLNNMCKTVIYKDDNPFPKLMMKKKYQDEKIIIQKVKKFKASSFRLKNDANIYFNPNKKIIEKWEKDRSFTSNKETLNWYKITGFFVDKKWQSAKNDMWVKKSDTIKR